MIVCNGTPFMVDQMPASNGKRTKTDSSLNEAPFQLGAN